MWLGKATFSFIPNKLANKHRLASSLPGVVLKYCGVLLR
jgi:hypothetical protein